MWCQHVVASMNVPAGMLQVEVVVIKTPTKRIWD